MIVLSSLFFADSGGLWISFLRFDSEMVVIFQKKNITISERASI